MCKQEIVSEEILELIEKHCLDKDGQLNRDKAKGIILGCLTRAMEDAPYEYAAMSTLWD